jgi:uncharacterized membrane protein YdjX (TVP38/TMEM64 family)
MANHSKSILKYLPWVITFGLLLILVGAYFISPEYKDFINKGYQVLSSGDKDQISSWLQSFDAWGAPVLVLAMVVQMFALVINSVLLMLIAVLAYGKWWGSLLALLAVLIASTVGYWIGRMIGENAVQQLIGARTEKKIQKGVKKYGIWIVILARISPLLSNDAISFVAGITGMGYWKFIGATTVGILPLIGLLAWLEQDWERMDNVLIWVTAGSFVLLGAYLLYDKYWNKEAEE